MIRHDGHSRRNRRDRPTQLAAGRGERLLRVCDVAETLGVTQRTLRAWIAGGKLPVVRLSARCIRIRAEDLQEFIERRRSGMAE